MLFKIPKGEVGGPVKNPVRVAHPESRRPQDSGAPVIVQVRAMIKNRLQEQKNTQLNNQLTEQARKRSLW